MDKDFTAIICVVDRSGSIHVARNEFEEALQGFLTEQGKQPGLVRVDFATFSTSYTLDHRMADPLAIKVELEPRGGTALYDAVGNCINGFSSEMEKLPPHARPSKVVLLVATDGEDNSSVQFTADSIRELVQAKQDVESWEALFMAAEQDAVREGEKLGFKADACITFKLQGGSRHATQAASRFVTDVRRGNRTGFTEAERGAATRRS
jgi:von Willebrand factor type A domain.